MEILVTGGAGFIGANLCRRLLRDGGIGHVRVLDDLSTGSKMNLHGAEVEFVHGSILDDEAMRVAARNVDAIIHLAAVPSVPRSITDPVRSHEVNATGTLRVLEAARNAGVHVILASSSSVYGANPVLPKVEDLQCRPMSPYAVSKLAAEQYAMAYATCYDLPVLPFRFFNVFGPLQAAGHDYAAVIPTWLDAALAGRPLPINGDGQQTRDFTFVDTVTEVLTQAVLQRITSAPVNLAFGSRTPLNELVVVMEKVLDRSLDRSYREPRAGDVPHSQADSGRLRDLFPTVRPVDLVDGIAKTAAWMSQQ
jgi:UDP-glucose 4-epimerase